MKVLEIDNPLFTEIDSIVDSCVKDCLNNYFYKFKYESTYDFKLRNIIKNETINLIFSGKSMNLFDIIKNLTVARQNVFVFNQINKLIIKIYSHQQNKNVSYHLKFQIPMCRRQIFDNNITKSRICRKFLQCYGKIFSICMSELVQSVKLRTARHFEI